MSKSAIILLAMLVLGTPVAVAQAPTEQPAVTTAKLNLTLEQKHVIKEVLKDLKIAPSTTSAGEVGDAVPPGAAMQPMPDDIGRKVPQIRSHRLIVTAERAIIVDPKDNKVAEIIDLN